MIEQLSTPVGSIVFAVKGDALLALGFEVQWPELYAGLVRRFGNVGSTAARSAIAAKLARYLDGDLAAIETIRTDVEGTPFQQRVWEQLREIPSGETIAYSELAMRLGSPTASRAVGAANGRNPVAIVVPCHRVIGKAGTLTGYAGGIERKRWLLAHEQRHAPRSHVASSMQLAFAAS